MEGASKVTSVVGMRRGQFLPYPIFIIRQVISEELYHEDNSPWLLVDTYNQQLDRSLLREQP